jgi:hypothetical protein
MSQSQSQVQGVLEVSLLLMFEVSLERNIFWD